MTEKTSKFEAYASSLSSSISSSKEYPSLF
jgi:hypothetical protein